MSVSSAVKRREPYFIVCGNVRYCKPSWPNLKLIEHVSRCKIVHFPHSPWTVHTPWKERKAVKLLPVTCQIHYLFKMEGYTWTPNQWIKEMTCNLAMEKLTFLAKEKIEDFYRTRKPFFTIYNGFVCTENYVVTDIHMCWEYDTFGWVGVFRVGGVLQVEGLIKCSEKKESPTRLSLSSLHKDYKMSKQIIVHF